MHDYELVYIINPTVPDDELETRTNRISQLITERGGEVVKVTPWGRRRLAYQIDRHRDGVYVSHEFRSPPRAIDDLERALRLYDDVIRYTVVRKPEVKQPLPRRLRRQPRSQPAAAPAQA